VVDNFFLLSAVFLPLTTNGDIGKLSLLLSFITPTGRKTVTYDKNIHSKIQHTQTISYKSENKSSTHKQLKLTPTFHADSSGAARKDKSARLRGWVPPCHVPIKFSQVSKPMYTLLLCIFSFDYFLAYFRDRCLSPPCLCSWGTRTPLGDLRPQTSLRQLLGCPSSAESCTA